MLGFLKSEALHPADFTIREDGVVRLNPELARQVGRDWQFDFRRASRPFEKGGGHRAEKRRAVIETKSQIIMPRRQPESGRFRWARQRQGPVQH